ncbi:hypothetical protein FJY93_02305 [Candidatus Kaiserbacteria bacterium]|nr:hypothetical protein [Candidatus Kaiserbacteria bacterium]
MSSNPDGWRGVKLEHGHLIDQIKNATAKDWENVCITLGLHVRTDYGRGSHAVAYKDTVCAPADRSCLVLTIPKNLFAQIQRDMFKKVLYFGIESGRYNEDNMWKAFNIK